MMPRGDSTGTGKNKLRLTLPDVPKEGHEPTPTENK
jgi:hypothetical protein